ncbi:hypothetical protein KCP74_11455 [Salmonella enterica subsp. enterica]|nr:hypothetical protein KCP74_11455 [Salmonella enterica subsp. enterica]
MIEVSEDHIVAVQVTRPGRKGAILKAADNPLLRRRFWRVLIYPRASMAQRSRSRLIEGRAASLHYRVIRLEIVRIFPAASARAIGLSVRPCPVGFSSPLKSVKRYFAETRLARWQARRAGSVMKYASGLIPYLTFISSEGIVFILLLRQLALQFFFFKMLF